MSKSLLKSSQRHSKSMEDLKTIGDVGSPLLSHADHRAPYFSRRAGSVDMVKTINTDTPVLKKLQHIQRNMKDRTSIISSSGSGQQGHRFSSQSESMFADLTDPSHICLHTPSEEGDVSEQQTVILDSDYEIPLIGEQKKKAAKQTNKKKTRRDQRNSSGVEFGFFNCRLCLIWIAFIVLLLIGALLFVCMSTFTNSCVVLGLGSSTPSRFILPRFRLGSTRIQREITLDTGAFTYNTEHFSCPDSTIRILGATKCSVFKSGDSDAVTFSLKGCRPGVDQQCGGEESWSYLIANSYYGGEHSVVYFSTPVRPGDTFVYRIEFDDTNTRSDDQCSASLTLLTPELVPRETVVVDTRCCDAPTHGTELYLKFDSEDCNSPKAMSVCYRTPGDDPWWF
eukprot:gnl/Dysnectes_brevis/7112_a11621_249.p1 GENE.gnl/Dysnectes_brevis/7112_a11621_249~~gnl/Dysnectes_brevis/7112_a11621_249.p1  ORF type:complete len:395 (+),score=78.65 gnl/Dysnectes_brevis/7112_a11621_249:48-1232(+)